MPELDRKDALWLTALVIIVLFFFHGFLVQGLIPINADWLQANFNPGRGYLSGITPQNIELDDPVRTSYPLRMEAVSQWKSGTVPLWNPGILCGNPLLADGISKPFDPLILVWFFLSGPVAHGVELVLQFVLMITGMYVLGRALALSRAGAAVAACVYTFNLLSVTWMELRTVTGAFAFFPWAFVFLIAALERRKLSYAAGAALFAALMEFAGHAQFAGYGFAILAAFVLWRTGAAALGEGRGAAMRVCFVGSAALALALALSAVETLPFIEFAVHSGRNPREYELPNLSSTPLSFVTYLYPNFFGNPAHGAYIGADVLMRPYMTAAAGFVGASTLVLALAGLFIGRVKSKSFFTAAALAILLTLVCTGAGLGQALSAYTHLFSAMDVARLVFISNFALAVLAGAGAGALGNASWKDIRYRRLGVTVATALVLVVLGTAFLGKLGPQLALGDFAQAKAFAWFVGQVEQHFGHVLLWPPVYTALAFLAGGAAVVLLAGDLPRVAPAVSFAVVAGELLLTGISYNPYVPSELVAPEWAPLAAVKGPAYEGRILGVDAPGGGELVAAKGDWLVPNTATLYGFQDVRGDESLRIGRYDKYIQHLVGKDTNTLAAVHMHAFNSPFIDSLNVRYILSSAPLASRHLELVFDDGKSYVYFNSRAVPRARLVGEWETARTETGALVGMYKHAGFDAARQVVIEPGAEELPERSLEFPGGTAVITAYQPRRVDVKTDCPSAAVLVLADAYYPGWRAEVDGVERPIFPADCALRAVYLAAGSHEVSFRYAPYSFALGALVSAAGLVAFLMFIGLPGIAMKKRKLPASTRG